MINNWTEDIEQYCSDLGEQACWCSYAHQQAEHHYNQRAFYTSVLLNFVSITSAGISIVDTYASSAQLTITVKILSIIIATLVKYQTSNNDADISSLHRNIASDYYNLFDMIRFTLSLPRDQRVDSTSYMNEVRSKFITLYKNITLIPKSVVLDIETNHKFDKLSKPVYAGGATEINVGHTDTHTTMLNTQPSPSSPNARYTAINTPIGIRFSRRPSNGQPSSIIPQFSLHKKIILNQNTLTNPRLDDALRNTSWSTDMSFNNMPASNVKQVSNLSTTNDSGASSSSENAHHVIT